VIFKFRKYFLNFDIYDQDTYNAHQIYTLQRDGDRTGPILIPHFTAAKASTNGRISRNRICSWNVRCTNL